MKFFFLWLMAIHPLFGETWVANDGRSIEGDIAGSNEAAIFIRPQGEAYWKPIKREVLSAKSLALAEAWLGDKQNQERRKWRSALWRPWPKEVRVIPSKLVEVEVGLVFESAHYRLASDFKLDVAAAKSILQVAEFQWQLCKRLPLYFSRQSLGDGRKFDIRIFAREQDYQAAGGGTDTAAMHVWRMKGKKGKKRKMVADYVLIPRSTLKTDNRAGVSAGRMGIVRHELVHQLMGPEQKERPWLMEGVAEFVSTIPLSNRFFRLETHRKAIVKHLSSPGNGGHRLAVGKSIRLPRVEQLLAMDLETLMDDPWLNYAASLLLVEFLATNDEQLLQRHLESIAEGQGKRAGLTLELLAPILEGEIPNRWKELGLKLTYQ